MDEIVAMKVAEVARAHTKVKGRRLNKAERDTAFSSEVKDVLGSSSVSDEEVKRHVLVSKKRVARNALTACMETIDADKSSTEKHEKRKTCKASVKDKMKDFGDDLNDVKTESII